MPHSRTRFATPVLQKQARFWPIVGLIGARQVGKTTLMQSVLKGHEHISLDDDEAREEAETTPKVFLAKRQEPLLIDEIQKTPKLFDALKLAEQC